MAQLDPNAPGTYVSIPTAGQTPPGQPVIPVDPRTGQAVLIQAPDATAPEPRRQAEVIVYSHSNLFYWWPAWVVGFLMAFVTYAYGEQFQVGDRTEYYHPDSVPGVVFFMTLLLVILITNVSLRGLMSAIVVMGAVLATVLLAYFDLWDRVLGWFAGLNIHMNLGAYFWFSAALFMTWVVTVFLFDHMSYWRVTPGQITRVHVLGAGSRSYDTENLVLEKHRDDLFRHWILGLGSGDLHITTHGARADRVYIPNVLFVGSKVAALERMIASEPVA